MRALPARSRRHRRARGASGAPDARRPPRLLRGLLQLFRLLTVACALQLSSAAHLVDFILGPSAGCIDTCAAAHDEEQGEHGCPPGCPSCACPHGRLPSLPPSVADAIPEPIAFELSEAWMPYRAGTPPSPPLPELDRPPRA